MLPAVLPRLFGSRKPAYPARWFALPLLNALPGAHFNFRAAVIFAPSRLPFLGPVAAVNLQPPAS